MAAPTLLPWLLASMSAVLLFAAGVLAWSRQRKVQQRTLPTEWALTARPVFSADERRAYRQLREALPHHIVLSKLPLVRFCQPTDAQQVRYWYQLLGSSHVSFAICSANERSTSRRSVQIKQAVLNACRVRYLRCPPQHLPSVPELQLLVPHTTVSSRMASNGRGLGGNPGAGKTDSRRQTLWQDSTFIQDSFFGVDPRDTPISDFGALRASGELPSTASDPMERILRPHLPVRH
jgi:hypothetical protein